MNPMFAEPERAVWLLGTVVGLDLSRQIALLLLTVFLCLVVFAITWFLFRHRQFSLRKLLILVTVIGLTYGYVGWQWRVVRERKAVYLMALERTGSRATGLVGPATVQNVRLKWPKSYQVPLIRKALGDRPYSGVESLRASPEFLERFQRAFPEATLSSPEFSSLQQQNGR